MLLLIVAPEDYNAVTTTLTFDPDTSRNCVDFTGFEDGIVEPDENFTVSLTSGDDVVLTPDTAVVTIVEGVGKQLHARMVILCKVVKQTS